ncbi:MAG TPA: LytS/YhcK type 5TM receptor domain-containing protein, partial [Dongiaceae bacterium]
MRRSINALRTDIATACSEHQPVPGVRGGICGLAAPVRRLPVVLGTGAFGRDLRPGCDARHVIAVSRRRRHLDSRVIIITVAAATSGPLAGAVCAIIAALFRGSIGGARLSCAWTAMAVAYCIAVAFWWVHRKRPEAIAASRFAALGLAVS